MSFPFTYTQRISFHSKDYWIEEIPQDIDLLLKHFIRNKGFKVIDNHSFSSNNSLFSIPFRIRFSTERNKDSFVLKYQLDLRNQLNSILIIFLLSAFFSRFSFAHYLWFGTVISLAFYGLSLSIIKAGIRKSLAEFIDPLKKVRTEADINSWVKEKEHHCPACETPLQQNDLFCPNCGLKVRQNPYTKPLNLNMNAREEESVKEN